MKKIIVLDSSVFFDGFNPTSVDDTMFIIPKSVIEEIKDIKSKERLENYLVARKIIVEWIEDKYRRKIKDVATKLGDITFLSEEDIDVIATAWKYRLDNEDVYILSNDYTIANVSKKLGIQVKTYTKQGIKKIKKSALYCPSCKRTFYGSKFLGLKICPVCGGKLIRKRFI